MSGVGKFLSQETLRQKSARCLAGVRIDPDAAVAIAQELRNIAMAGIVNMEFVREEEPLLVGTGAGDALNDVEIALQRIADFAADILARAGVKP